MLRVIFIILYTLTNNVIISDIDECASNPCDIGGTCYDLINGYRCQCVDGYTGEQCQISELRLWLKLSDLSVHLVVGLYKNVVWL